MRGVELKACVPADAPAIRGDARRLIAAAQAGDAAARDALVLANLPLIGEVVRRDLRGHASPIDDLIQSGVFGLMDAIDRFDLSRGLSFTTYAYKLILYHVQQCERTATAVKRPSRWFHGGESRAKLSAGWHRAVRRAGRVQCAGLIGRRDGPDAGATAYQGPVVPDHVPACDAGLDAAEALARLTPKQREVVALRFGLDGGPELGPTEVGERLGVSRQAALQAEGRALERMRGVEGVAR